MDSLSQFQNNSNQANPLAATMVMMSNSLFPNSAQNAPAPGFPSSGLFGKKDEPGDALS